MQTLKPLAEEAGCSLTQFLLGVGVARAERRLRHPRRKPTGTARRERCSLGTRNRCGSVHQGRGSSRPGPATCLALARSTLAPTGVGSRIAIRIPLQVLKLGDHAIVDPGDVKCAPEIDRCMWGRRIPPSRVRSSQEPLRIAGPYKRHYLARETTFPLNVKPDTNGVERVRYNPAALSGKSLHRNGTWPTERIKASDSVPARR